MLKEYDGIQIAGLRCAVAANSEEKAADTAVKVAEDLFRDYGIAEEDVRVMIYVTQSPLFMTPSTSFYIAKKLNLGQDCYQYDMKQGATGMLKGAQLIASLLLSFNNADKGLLLIADDGLERDLGKRAMASALLFEHCGKGQSKFWIQNCSLGRYFSRFYQGENDETPCVDNEFLISGKKMLEKQKEEMLGQWQGGNNIPDNTVLCDKYDSAVRLPMLLEKELIQGRSLLGALGAGMSVDIMICDLKKDIYSINQG